MTVVTLLLFLVVVSVMAIAAGILIGLRSGGNRTISLVLIIGGVLALLAIGGFVLLIFIITPG